MSSEYLSFQIKACDNQTSTVTCADFGDDEALFKEYLDKHSLLILNVVNFVDYSNIEPFEGPLKQTTQFMDVISLGENPSMTLYTRYSFVEHQVELEDSLW